MPRGENKKGGGTIAEPWLSLKNGGGEKQIPGAWGKFGQKKFNKRGRAEPSNVVLRLEKL